MWDGIAHSQLGSVMHVAKLMNLNTAHIEHYIFPAGIVLTLPDISADKPGGLPPWKQVSG